MRPKTLFSLVAIAVTSVSVTAAYVYKSPPRVEATLVAEPTEFNLRTGDSFWGLHLDGIVSLSTLLVKGGGHLVIISPVEKPDAKAYYQVRGEKTIQLEGITFLLTVTGDDQAHVGRVLEKQLAAN